MFHAILMILVAVLVGLAANYFLWHALDKLPRYTESTLPRLLARQLRRPSLYVVPLLAVAIVLDPLADRALFPAMLYRPFKLVSIAALAWVAISALRAVRDFLLERYDIEARDNLEARKVATQLGVIEKVLTVVIVLIAVASGLMTFESIAQFGKGLLASAGVAGIIIGFAAQRSISTFVAGLQIAMTQPIRLDDVVIVEGEWGKIEEITLTYVVVRIWDLRRLIVPINFFIEKPFQNWTRVSADLLGTVLIYTDYSIPIARVREELTRILEASPHWDHKVNVLQVTDSTDRALELRALMSAADSSALWDLRVHAREKLLEFIQREYPKSLPRVRAELQGPAQGPLPAEIGSD